MSITDIVTPVDLTGKAADAWENVTNAKTLESLNWPVTDRKSVV